MRKILVFVLACILACTAMPALATDGFHAEGYPIVDEKITLTMMGSKSPIQGDWNEMMLFDYMEEMTNIHFEFRTVPADSYLEKKNLAFASGDLPDLFFGGALTPSDEINYGTQGLLIPLNDLIDQYAVNLLERFEENPGMRQNITTPDGNIYALPQVNTAPRAVQVMYWANFAWLDALGLTAEDMPTTLDELYDTLVLFYENDPNGNGEQDEIPLSFRNAFELRDLVMFAYGAPSNNLGIYAQEDGAVVYQYTTDNFRKYLEYARKLYAEGLLDQNMFTQNSQQMVANSKENRVGITSDSLPGNMFSITDEEALQYPALAPLTSADNDVPMKRLNNSTTRGLFAITSENEYPEATIRWVDYFYSYYGSLTLFQGVENETWQYVDDEQLKWEQIVPEGWASEEYRAQNTPDCGTACPKFQFPRIIQGKTHIADVYADECGFALLDYCIPCYPVVYFTDEENASLTTLETDIKTYVEEMEAQFITGRLEINDDNWNQYVSTLTDSIGLPEYVNLHQAAYDRWASN